MKRKVREELPHDVVEEILERILEVKSLVRLRCVSKQWNSNIISNTSFASRHLIRAHSRDPHVVFRVDENYIPISYLCSWDIKSSDPFQRFHIFPKSNNHFYITGSCDGLVCVYSFISSLYVINPATRWSRSLPCSWIQNINQVRQKLDGGYYRSANVGFGKDTITGKYKMVWLYNSLELDLEEDSRRTTCEVFDFDTNTWRYVISTIHSIYDCLYLDGSLYWSTFGKLKLTRFDLHTEVFQEMEQLPLADTSNTIMCSLHNRLCLSEKKSNMNQDIWSLNSDKKIWEKTYTINASIDRSLLNGFNKRYSLESPFTPITVFNKTEMLLLNEYTDSPYFIIHDIRTGSYSLIQDSGLVRVSSYFPSLISI